MTTRYKYSPAIFLCLLLITVITTSVNAQEVQPKKGFHVGSGYSFSEIETINTTNGNLSLNIPLANLPPSHGNLGGSLNLFYNSKLYRTHVEEVLDASGQQALQNLLGAQVDKSSGGWDYSAGYYLKITNRNDGGYAYQCIIGDSFGSQRSVYIWKVEVVYPDGGAREFRPSGFNDFLNDGYFNVSPITPIGRILNVSVNQSFCNVIESQATLPLTYYSTDGSYSKLTLQANGDWTLSFADGGHVSNSNSNGQQQIFDRNNNFITLANFFVDDAPVRTITDNFGRQIRLEHITASGDDKIYAYGSNGEELITTIKWKQISVTRSYKTTGVTTGPVRGGTSTQTLHQNFKVVDQIILPVQSGGLAYTFGYNPGTTTPSSGWGEINLITLPTGAQASYLYEQDATMTPLANCRDVLDNSPATKTLSYQNSYDNATTTATEQWGYSIGNSASVVVHPDGGIVTQLYGDTTSNSKYAGLIESTTTPDGKTVENTWQFNYPKGSNTTANINAYIKTQYTSIRHSPGDATPYLTAIKDFNYDKNGNLTQAVEYDWVDYADVPRSIGRPTGIPNTAVVKRVTVNTYVNATPDATDTTTQNSFSYHEPSSQPLRNAIASTEVRPGLSDSPVESHSEFSYDNASTTGNVTLVRHWDSTKGNLPLSPANCLVNCNFVSTSNQYSSWLNGATGRLDVTIDANGNYSRFTYGYINNGLINDLYPTSVVTGDNAAGTSPLKRTSNTQYDFSTGLVTLSTDVDNNSSTKTTYDAFGRPTQVLEGIVNNDSTTALRKTTMTYSDIERRIITQSGLNTPSDGLLISVQHYDQLGRLRLARTLENGNISEAQDETKGIKVQTRYLYDTANQRSLEITSAPYRAATSSAATNEAGMAWRCSLFDNTGRLREVETFTGTALPAPLGNNTNSTGKILTNYDAQLVSVTDQAGKNRKSGIDALGRLVKVWEDPTPGGNNYETTYTYNALDNLIQTTQTGVPLGGSGSITQTRTFSYDSLKRLVLVTNPESGTMRYTYDPNGNLLTKTDARKWVTRYTYDALNRNKTVDYSNTLLSPDITRIYDNPIGSANGKGLLWKEYSNGSETAGTNVEYREIGNYDKLGRPLSVNQKAKFDSDIWTALHTTTQTYNSAGQVVGAVYPSNRTVNYGYDSAGRLTNFSGNLGGNTYTYATGLTYNARGQLQREQFGTATALYHRMYYNARGQMVQARLGTGSSGFDNEVPPTDMNGSAWTSWDRGALRWEYGSTNQNNGNVTRQEHLIPQGQPNLAYTVQLYNYDALNRLTSVVEKTGTQDGNGVKLDGAPLYTQAYLYDRWGNRRVDPNTTTQALGWPILKQYTVDATTNRLVAFNDANSSGKDLADRMKYDEAGNLIFDSWTDGTTGTPSAGKRTYDAENRMVKAVGPDGRSYSYAYDASGRRVRRIIYNGSAQEIWWQVYGVGGELVAEYKVPVVNNAPTLPPVLQKEYGYRNGQLLVVYDMTETGSQQWKWLVPDALGTPRMIVGASGRLTDDPTTSAVNEQLVRHDYLPFGEELFAGSGASPVRTTGNGYGTDKIRQKFVGYERDNETGLDFAQARYYSNVQGRFTSPDPLLSSGKQEDPQSWNRYSYVGNRPTIFIDPTGLAWGYFSGNGGNFYKWFDDEADIEKNGGTVVKANAANGFIYESWEGWVRLDLGQNKWTQYQTHEQAFYNQQEFPTAMGDMGHTLGLFMAAEGLAKAATGAGELARRLFQPSASEDLVHLTTAEAATQIQASGVLRGNIYAGPASNASASGWGVTLRTGLNPGDYEAIAIPAAGRSAFSQVVPTGPFTAWQRLMGTQYTARGTLDLSTGAFTRTGVNWNQVGWHAADAVVVSGAGFSIYQSVKK